MGGPSRPRHGYRTARQRGLKLHEQLISSIIYVFCANWGPFFIFFRAIEITDTRFMRSEVIKQRLLGCTFHTFPFNWGGAVERTQNSINTFIKLQIERENVMFRQGPLVASEVAAINEPSRKT